MISLPTWYATYRTLGLARRVTTTYLLTPRLAARDVTPVAVDWLSQGRLALGHLHILDGDPCTGKSWVALDIARALSLGQPPFVTAAIPEEKPRASLLLMAEDSIKDTLVPRLSALGADLSYVHLYDPNGPGQPWTVPTGYLLIKEACQRVRPTFIAIDPIVSFLSPSVQLYNDAAVRVALRPLGQLAEQFHCAVLMIRHLNKAVRQRALYRGSGSIAFSAAARIGMAMAPSPNGRGENLLVTLKNNLAQRSPALRFSLARAGRVGVTWEGELDPLTEQFALSEGGRRSKVARAREFLLALLGTGPRSAEDVWREAQALDLSARTVNTAKAALGIVSRREIQNDMVVSQWMLPADAAKEPAAELIASMGDGFAQDPFASPTEAL